MAFNTSLGREDTSMKLRSQNIKEAKNMTRQLEVENHKMEQRLTELKMAIKKDRAERGNTGFWGKGQQGSLGNYANDILNQPNSQPSSAKSERSSGKKKKVKVLKDEPTGFSARLEKKFQPGTFANIAMRDTTPQPRIKGPKCGQCELKVAHVACHECGEDYCAACFAAFHLKGALRRHRSVPIGSNGALTARSASRSSIIDGSGASGEVPPRSQRAPQYSDADLSVLPAAGRTPSPVSNGYSGPSLLDGAYDEREAQASFQQALAEWRQGKAPSGGQMPSGGQTSHSPAPSSRSTRRDSTKAKGVSVESGTSTESATNKKPVEINFTSTSELTYAEKLLLKKLRREQGGISPRYDPQTQTIQYQEAPVFDDAALDAEVERVSFQALANAVKDAEDNGEEEQEEEEEEERPESHVSIVEVKRGQARTTRGLEQTAMYKVSEVPEEVQPRSSRSAAKDTFMAPSPPSSAKRRSPTARRHLKSPQSPVLTPGGYARVKSNTPSPDSDNLRARNTPRDSSNMTPRKRSTWAKSSRDDLDFTSLMASSDDPLKKKNKPPSRPGSKIKKGASLSKKSPLKDSNQDIPLDLSLEGHPLETNRSEHNLGQSSHRALSRSAGGQRSQSRTGSRAGSATSRPGSRPPSRTKSRAALMSIFGEGTLTKTPSLPLKEVADLAGRVKTPLYTPGVGEFLVAGVSQPQEERVLTPSGRRSRVSSARDEKFKISYKLYDMGPRSWRPESSLQIAVDQVDPIEMPRSYTRHPDPEIEKESKVAYSLREPGSSRTVLTSQDEVVMDLDTPRTTAPNFTPRSAFHESPRNVTFREDSPQSAGSARSCGSATFRVNRPATPGKTPRINTPREDELTPIVVDGEDMSKFDDDRATSRQEEQMADTEALDQLEWELASQTGRVDADGNISRMSHASLDSDHPPSDDKSDGENKTPEAQFDFNTQLRASVLMDDFEEMEQRLMEEEVKNLK